MVCLPTYVVLELFCSRNPISDTERVRVRGWKYRSSFVPQSWTVGFLDSFRHKDNGPRTIVPVVKKRRSQLPKCFDVC
jgi:hypothetical protein